MEGNGLNKCLFSEMLTGFCWWSVLIHPVELNMVFFPHLLCGNCIPVLFAACLSRLVPQVLLCLTHSWICCQDVVAAVSSDIPYVLLKHGRTNQMTWTSNEIFILSLLLVWTVEIFYVGMLSNGCFLQAGYFPFRVWGRGFMYPECITEVTEKVHTNRRKTALT